MECGIARRDGQEGFRLRGHFLARAILPINEPALIHRRFANSQRGEWGPDEERRCKVKKCMARP